MPISLGSAEREQAIVSSWNLITCFVFIAFICGCFYLWQVILIFPYGHDPQFSFKRKLKMWVYLIKNIKEIIYSLIWWYLEYLKLWFLEDLKFWNNLGHWFLLVHPQTSSGPWQRKCNEVSFIKLNLIIVILVACSFVILKYPFPKEMVILKSPDIGEIEYWQLLVVPSLLIM